MRLPSNMTHDFSNVPNLNIPRSVFDRSHTYKTTIDADYLYPFIADFVIPGTTLNVNSTLFARMLPTVNAPMDNLFLDTFYFSVPMRLLQTNFVKMCGETVDPGDSTNYSFPTIPCTAGTGWTSNSLSDYLGLPTLVTGISANSLWHRAYNLIWNTWFRDQNLQDSVVVDVDDGPDTDADYVLLKRCKKHDYFTSALPWPSKNNSGTAVSLPIGTTADVLPVATEHTSGAYAYSPIWRTVAAGAYGSANNAIGVGGSGTTHQTASGDAGTGQLYPSNLQADLSGASASTINELREAWLLQEAYEMDARGGSRYHEIIKSHFGTEHPVEAWRPEYLGGSSVPINLNVVPQTAITNGTDYQGSISANGVAIETSSGFVKSFTEHCVIMGIMNVRADINYQEGLDRMFNMSTRWDMPWPVLAHMGEQEILDQELYCPNNGDTDTWGYQERYAERRYKRSLITGHLRSNHATTLHAWHVAEYLNGATAQNATWIQSNTPMTRILAQAGSPHFIVDGSIKYIEASPLPVYGTPLKLSRL
jgi:hypothetical protein